MFIKSNVKISSHCENLTGISQKDIEQGVSLIEALSYFKDNFEPTNYVGWGSYGRFTKDILLLNLKNLNVKWRPPDNHINIQQEFAVRVMRSEIAYGMRGALGFIGLTDVDNKSCEDEILNLGILYNKILQRDIK